MRIDYELSKKEYRQCYNLAQGIYANRKQVKKNPYKRVCSFSIILLKNYLRCFLLIPFIAFFDTCVNLSFLEDIAILLFLFLFFMNTILLIVTSITYFLSKKRTKKGELRLEEHTITDTTEYGKTISKQWEEIDFVYVTKKAIFVIAKKRFIFVIPESTRKLEPALNYLKTIQEKNPKIKIIETIPQDELEEKKWKQHFLNWGIYIVLFLVLMTATVAWDMHNFYKIAKEMAKIEETDYEIDNTIYSFQKYGKVEKELKDFFHTYRTNYNTYLKNSATGIMYLLNIEFLEKEKDNLKEIIKEFPNMENKTQKAIEKIIELADEEKWRMNLEKMELGDSYIDVFKEYAFSFANNRFKREWEMELYNNQLRMQYLTRMVEILTLPNACWYIEKKNLYFCDDAQLKEYNELYDLLMKDNNKQFSNGVKM